MTVARPRAGCAGVGAGMTRNRERREIDPVGRRGRAVIGLAGVGGTHADPTLEIGDDRLGQLAARRHLQEVVPQGVEDHTFLRGVRDDRWTDVAPLADRLARVEPQPPLDGFRLGRVALVTVLHEHGPDVRLEELDPLRVVRPGRSADEDRAGPREPGTSRGRSPARLPSVDSSPSTPEDQGVVGRTREPLPGGKRPGVGWVPSRAHPRDFGRDPTF